MGGVLSAIGLAPLLTVFGFWMGGGLLLLILVPIALVILFRQRALREGLSLAVGTVIGLGPGLWFYARETAEFWLELGFPLAIGCALALTVAPLYVVVVRRRTRLTMDRSLLLIPLFLTLLALSATPLRAQRAERSVTASDSARPALQPASGHHGGADTW